MAIKVFFEQSSWDRHPDAKELKNGLIEIFRLVNEDFDYGQLVACLDGACREVFSDGLKDILEAGT